MHHIHTFLEEKKDELYHYLKEIVEHESPSHDKALLDELASWISTTFETLTGGYSTIIENKEQGNHVLGEWGEGDGQILMLAHFDTVWPKGTLDKKPFRVKDGIATGPGVFDMKGGLSREPSKLRHCSKQRRT